MKDVLFTVEKNREIAPETFELVLHSDEPLPPLRCGQFLHLEVPSDALLLRRPFCLCKYDAHTVTLIIAKVGKGTESLAKAAVGTPLKAIVPIGNGFTLQPQKHRTVVLIGGGVGVAPLLAVPKTYPFATYHAYLGYADKSRVLLADDFAAVAHTTVCTDDGSFGQKGYPTDALDADLPRLQADAILTCGSEPLLKAVARVAAKHKVPAYMSGEARMGCGVGACLVCTCGVRQADGSVANKRTCVDGPVFRLEDIVW